MHLVVGFNGWLGWQYFFTVLFTGLSAGSLYALIALGYSLVYGVLKLLNFAHGDVFMVGAYIGYFVLTALGWPLSPKMPLAPLLLLAFAAAMLGCALLGATIERFAYRPLRKAPRIAPLISALGVSFFLQQTAVLLWSPNPRTYNTYGFHNAELLLPHGVSNVRFSYAQLLVVLSAAVLMVALSLFVWKTRTGKAMRAVSVDPEAASMMGIDVDRVIMVTFLLGSALAGAAGVMTGVLYSQFDPYMGLGYGLKAFIAAVVGGIGNIGGAVLGGLLVGLIEAFTGAYLTTSFSDLIVFSVLIIVMLVRPTGIRGVPVLQKV
jgi:branched-chain amino acid transport system permease protein